MASPTRVVVLFPLKTERQQLAQTLKDPDLAGIEIRTGGLGGERITAAVEALVSEHAARAQRPDLVVLLGCAGGLRPGLSGAPPVGMVIDEAGNEFIPSIIPAGDDEQPVTLLGVDTLVPDVAAKRTLHARTAADMVDMESHAFALACSGHGLRWAIIRGVSDTADESLPDYMRSWIDDQGNYRLLRIALSLLSNPARIKEVQRVATRFGEAMKATLPRLKLARNLAAANP
jgi:hypothetical protein